VNCNAELAATTKTALAGLDVPSRWIFIGLIVYFALHVLFRVLASGTVELDEAEQVLLAQDWRWGYGVQPPLYTWLQKVFFGVFGESVFALSLLKHLLLLGTFVLTWCTAREIANDGQTALLAMGCLLFVPQFAWESHRDLTHSVAATTFGVATLFAAVRLLKYQGAIDYLVCGVLAGLGVLAKYNFAILLLALVVASLSTPQFRGSWQNRWLLSAVAGFLLTTGGHFAWLMERGVSPGTRDVARSLWAALGYWLVAVLSFSGIFLGLMVVIRWKIAASTDGDPILEEELHEKERRLESRHSVHDFVSLLARTLTVAVVLSLAVVILWKARFKDRWFQPILFALPLYFALWAKPRLTPRLIRLSAVIAVVIALATLLAVPAIPLGASITKRPTRLNLPYPALAGKIREAGIEPKVIIADSRLTGGNLRLHFPNAMVVVPEIRKPIPTREKLLVIWDAARREEIPSALMQLARDLGFSRQEFARAAYIEVPLQFMADRTARWGYVLLEAKQ
jgi:4-amino-4-deoxy-L-arabinose transferase-like glycosyltransferase